MKELVSKIKECIIKLVYLLDRGDTFVSNFVHRIAAADPCHVPRICYCLSKKSEANSAATTSDNKLDDRFPSRALARHNDSFVRGGWLWRGCLKIR